MSMVLVIDDELPLRRALRTSLAAKGFDVVEASNGDEGVIAVADRTPDLVVLDLGLPDVDGMEALARMRGFSDVPVIVLTARDQQSEKVAALDAGADDYITKPFDTEELVARIGAALRRRPVSEPPPAHVVVGPVEIDLSRHLVTLEGERVPLTRTELRLLEVLVTNPERLLTHEYLLRQVWGPSYGTESNYLRTFIGQLRKKLADDAADPQLIVTEPGIGYRWIGSRAE
jgi:two-component system, OmpR family, KDP operon response regulator KdpE